MHILKCPVEADGSPCRHPIFVRTVRIAYAQARLAKTSQPEHSLPLVVHLQLGESSIQITEAIRRRETISPADAHKRLRGLIERARIPNPERRLEGDLPEMSGGRGQRAMSMPAVACNPKILLADEPTTAPDATGARPVRRGARLGKAVLLVAALFIQPAWAQQPPTQASIAAAGAKRLGVSDFKARYIGNTLTGKTATGDAFDVYVASATRYRMRFQGKTSADRWRVNKAGEFCASAGAETTCTREFLLGDEIYSFNADGTLAGIARLRLGNPEKL